MGEKKEGGLASIEVKPLANGFLVTSKHYTKDKESDLVDWREEGEAQSFCPDSEAVQEVVASALENTVE